MKKIRYNFYFLVDYKTRIEEVLDRARTLGVIPVSCDSVSAFINEAVLRYLREVETQVKQAEKRRRA